MEYAENGSLLDIIRKDQHIDEQRGRRWFKQLVEAVDYCHERGVVHRLVVPLFYLKNHCFFKLLHEYI